MATTQKTVGEGNAYSNIDSIGGEKSAMTPLIILEQSLSIMMTLVLQEFARSLPSAGSWECGRCGSRIDVHRQNVDGMLSFDWTVTLFQPNAWHSKHALVLTSAGKLSISCESSPSGARPSDRATGAPGGISSSAVSYANLRRIVTGYYWNARGLEHKASAQSCGCDPGASWICDTHATDYEDFLLRTPFLADTQKGERQ